MINYYEIKGKELTLTNDINSKILEIINPTDEDIQMISKKFNIDKKMIYHIKDKDEIARYESMNNLNFISVLYPSKIDFYTYITRPMFIFWNEESLVVIVNENVKIFDKNLKNKNYIIEEDDKIEKLLLEIVWRLSQKYITVMKDLNKNIENLEEKIKKSSKTSDYYNIINLQKSIIEFDIAIEQNSPVIMELNNSKVVFVSDELNKIINSLQIEFKQAKVMVKKTLSILSAMSDLYTGIISNNLNDVMKILTSITIVLTVPTIIGGLWGMNVRLPFENLTNAFYIIVGLCILICILIFYLLKKDDYL